VIVGGLSVRVSFNQMIDDIHFKMYHGLSICK